MLPANVIDTTSEEPPGPVPPLSTLQRKPEIFDSFPRILGTLDSSADHNPNSTSQEEQYAADFHRRRMRILAGDDPDEAELDISADDALSFSLMEFNFYYSRLAVDAQSCPSESVVDEQDFPDPSDDSDDGDYDDGCSYFPWRADLFSEPDRVRVQNHGRADDHDYLPPECSDDDHVVLDSEYDSFEEQSTSDKSRYRRRLHVNHRKYDRIVNDNSATEKESTTRAALELHTLGFDLAQDFDPNVSIVHVSTLMHAAHTPGDAQAASRIKRLIQEVERMPKDERTAAQVYLLEHWRVPSWEQQTSTVAPPLSPSLSSCSWPSSFQPSPSIPHPLSRLSLPPSLFSQHSAPEIFVDASGRGIGFWFSERWLAWNFRRPRSNRNIPTDRKGKIIMSWAELIAVELGVLTLISAGYIDSKVIVRSDNIGVVVALARGTWKPEFGLQDVLELIIEMCRDFDLDLQMKWVASKNNPADGPSRKVYPPKEMIFRSNPVVPDHLRSILREASVL